MKVSIPGALGVTLLLAGGAATGLRGQAPATFIVESPTMTTGRFMPRDYTPDGRNLSPPLSWRGLPAGTRRLAVISQDYGAGRPPPWVLWVIYNIPASAQGLPEGLPFDSDHPMPVEITGAVQGNNGWGLSAFRGPAPPVGGVHHYHFAVFALDEELELPPGLDRGELLQAIEGHVIGQGDMVTLYERQPMNELPR